MNTNTRIVIITPTWAGDLEHFRVMRCSLEQSPLAELDHYVVVQHEDLPLFEEFRGRPGLHLLSTKDVLPEVVERRRVWARTLSDRFGRDFARICGSLKRLFSWPIWPSYTGWHTQQLCKLKLAAELDCDKAVVLDSDVIVTSAASVEDFSGPDGVVCFADWQERPALRGKVKNWVKEGEALVGMGKTSGPVNAYFDTPFVFDHHLLSLALRDLESRTNLHWWQALLDRPPRRWSEFGFYKAFLAHRSEEKAIDWREPEFAKYIYDTSEPTRLVESVCAMINDPCIHYVTIHSQSNGRKDWNPTAYLGPLLSALQGR